MCRLALLVSALLSVSCRGQKDHALTHSLTHAVASVMLRVLLGYASNALSLCLARLSVGHSPPRQFSPPTFPPLQFGHYSLPTKCCNFSISKNNKRIKCPTGGNVRYDTRCYFNVRSKADISQLNLPHESRWNFASGCGFEG